MRKVKALFVFALVFLIYISASTATVSGPTQTASVGIVVEEPCIIDIDLSIGDTVIGNPAPIQIQLTNTGLIGLVVSGDLQILDPSNALIETIPIGPVFVQDGGLIIINNVFDSGGQVPGLWTGNAEVNCAPAETVSDSDTFILSEKPPSAPKETPPSRGGGGRIVQGIPTGAVTPQTFDDISQRTRKGIGRRAKFTWRVGDGGFFTYNEQKHTVLVKSVKSDQVILQFESNPIIVTLETGQSKFVDLDDDGIRDILVELLGVEENGVLAAEVEISFGPFTKPRLEVPRRIVKFVEGYVIPVEIIEGEIKINYAGIISSALLVIIIIIVIHYYLPEERIEPKRKRIKKSRRKANQ